MKRILRNTLEIDEKSADPKVKLEANRIATDCYKYIIDKKDTRYFFTPVKETSTAASNQGIQ
jgi:hypothetical protein